MCVCVCVSVCLFQVCMCVCLCGLGVCLSMPITRRKLLDPQIRPPHLPQTRHSPGFHFHKIRVFICCQLPIHNLSFLLLNYPLACLTFNIDSCVAGCALRAAFVCFFGLVFVNLFYKKVEYFFSRSQAGVLCIIIHMSKALAPGPGPSCMASLL